MFITEKDHWKKKNEKFSNYVRNNKDLEKELRQIVQGMKISSEMENNIGAWYDELHHQNNQSRWFGSNRPIDWKNLLSYLILQEKPSLMALKSFLNEIYDQERLARTPVRFHHMVEQLQQKFPCKQKRLLPPLWIDEYAEIN